MEWEITILQFLEGLRGELANHIFEIITVTGETFFLGVIIIITYWCINKTAGLRLGFLMLFSTLGNAFLKNIIKAPRPFESGTVLAIRKHTATGYSFPSGHTQGVTTFWLALMLDIKQRWIDYLGILMIVLVGLSRLYLGVHWPVDVLGAIFVGIIFTVIGQYVFEKIRRLKMLKLLVAYLLIGGTLFLGFDGGYTKALGAMVGFIIGMELEERYISFRVKGSFTYQILKVIIGMGGLILIGSFLKITLPQTTIFDFIRYMLIVIWIIGGAPYIFNRIYSPKQT